MYTNLLNEMLLLAKVSFCVLSCTSSLFKWDLQGELALFLLSLVASIGSIGFSEGWSLLASMDLVASVGHMATFDHDKSSEGLSLSATVGQMAILGHEN